MIVNKYAKGGGSGSGASMEEYWNSAQTKTYVDLADTAVYNSAATYADVAVSGLASEQYVAQAVSGLASEEYVGQAVEGLVNSADVKTQVEAYNYITSADAKTQIEEYGYATTGDVQNATTGISADVTALSAATTGIATNIADLPTSADVETMINTKAADYTPTTGFSTINGSAITAGGNLVIEGGSGPAPDMSAYWTSSVTKTYVDSAITEVVDRLDDVELVAASAITDINARLSAISGGSVDLSGYYTSAQTDSAIASATSGMATQAWVGQQGYLTQHQSLADYYTSAQTEQAITSKNYVTSADVETQITSKNYITSAYTGFASSADMATVSGVVQEQQIVFSSGYNELHTQVLELSASTANMVVSTNVRTIWQGTQAQYDTDTNSGATASPTTFYIIIPNSNS